MPEREDEKAFRDWGNSVPQDASPLGSWLAACAYKDKEIERLDNANVTLRNAAKHDAELIARLKADLAKRIEAHDECLSKAMRALESLTPGGSEFVGDVDWCVRYIRETLQSQHRFIVRYKKERDAAEARVTELEAALREIVVACETGGEAKLAAILARDALKDTALAAKEDGEKADAK